jgi:DNA-directed RNA polymerase subunit RPC12/RpoP
LEKVAVTTDLDIGRQEALETRVQQIWTRGFPETDTVEDVFGPFESWLYRLGTQVLLLHPVSREWFYLDRLHDTWVRTGFGPQEAVFVAQGKGLGAKRRDGVAAAGAGQAVICPKCRARVTAGNPFCGQCGAAVAAPGSPVAEPSPAIVCRTCQHRNKPELLFCTQCGARLN